MLGKRLDFRRVAYLLPVLLLAIILTGCAGNALPGQPSPQPTPPGGSQPPVSAQPVAWTSDGKVGDNEYTQYQQIGDLQVFSRLEGDQVCMALRSQNKGYIALGIRPEFRMQGADMIICALNGNEAAITDAFSTGTFGPHPADTRLGGRDDILEPSGSLQDGWPTFEFKRQLVTGDSQDKALTAGDNPVIWATGGSADIDIQHRNRGYATLNLK